MHLCSVSQLPNVLCLLVELQEGIRPPQILTNTPVKMWTKIIIEIELNIRAN